MAEVWEELGETAGCQMWGIIGRVLAHQETNDNEIDAVKRRLFAFPDEAAKGDLFLEDIQQIKGAGELRDALNTYEPADLAVMFY